MDHSITQGSTSNTPVPSTHIPGSENTTSGRYTCYDTGIFLALYIILATTCTVDLASEAFEQSEKVLKAHQSIEITDAHRELAKRPGRKARRGAGGDQAGEKKMGRMRRRIGKLLERIMNRKAEK